MDIKIQGINCEYSIVTNLWQIVFDNVLIAPTTRPSTRAAGHVTGSGRGMDLH